MGNSNRISEKCLADSSHLWINNQSPRLSEFSIFRIVWKPQVKELILLGGIFIRLKVLSFDVQLIGKSPPNCGNEECVESCADILIVRYIVTQCFNKEKSKLDC